MGIIRTVTGDITPDVTGVILPHEHLFGRPPTPYDEQDPDLVLNDIRASTREAHDMKQQGVSVLVEMTPIDYHRAPIILKQISEASGLAIVCVTGYLKDKFSASLVSQMTVDDIAHRMIQEIQVGIGDTGVRAGVIKAASSLDHITENERKVFQAAALAQQQTGALISTHTEAGTMALEQIDLLVNGGVDPTRILIGHLDRKLDWDYHQQIAERGVYMGYDQISKSKYAPDTQRIEFIKRMVESGHGAQLMLSMDLARRSDFTHYGGTPGHTYFVENFIPMLHSAGLDAATVQCLTQINPRTALTMTST